MPSGGVCFCACDSDSDSSIYIQHKKGQTSQSLSLAIQAAKTDPPTPQPPSPIQETPTPPSSSENPPQKKKAKRQNRPPSVSTMEKYDEFIDYSASTSVERLARDVETILHGWHVVKGSDRHASVQVRSKKEDETPSKRHPQAQTPLLSQRASQTSLQLLRSEQLSWKISFYLPNGEHMSNSVDLELALWDGNAQSMGEDGTDSFLPLSLQRITGLAKMPLDVFANFSSLFGIGQHITLTPLDVDLGHELWQYLSESVQQRHAESSALLSVTSVLSGWLQSAMNLATISSECYFPVFGLWGPYQPQRQQLPVSFSDEAASILPVWLRNPQKMVLKGIPYRTRRKNQMCLNQRYVPPAITGQCLTPPSSQCEEKRVVFWTSLLQHVPSARIAGTDSRLTVWGNVLLRHCSDDSVALWGARHVYSWTRPTPTTRYTFFFSQDDDWDDTVWRKRDSAEVIDPNSAIGYRLLCQRYALKLMEEATCSSEEDPLWGPIQDPLASIHATVTWNAMTGGVKNDLQPLLTLPLKIRSKNDMSTEDFIEAEESIEQSILDPYRPSFFVVQVQGDPEIAAATLTATQRCVLAALIRTATLPAETMLLHLIDEETMAGWDIEVGNEIANQLADSIQAQPATKALVGAMDWEHAAEDMISPNEAENIVSIVFDAEIGLGYPERPEGDCRCVGPDDEVLFAPFQKSAPFGRLVSNLFMHMAGVRSPSSMALVFSTFCQELRRRWDNRESLPNMHYVPGLDPSPENFAPKRCFSNVGEKATFAAHVNSSEPDPDDWNCLVGQKMQVFNLCVETAIAEDLRKVEKIEKQTGALGNASQRISHHFRSPIVTDSAIRQGNKLGSRFSEVG